MRLADRAIGPGEGVFISAELGVTPNGDIRRAMALIDIVAASGADAAKFICTDPDKIMGARDVMFTYEVVQKLIAQDIDGSDRTEIASVRRVTRPIYDLLKETQFTFDEWHTLKSYCDMQGVIFYATVDHLDAVDLMESLGAPAYKICAWDLAYLPLIERVRKTTKPILIDVGAATREEVVDAIPLTDYGEQHLFVHAPHPINGADWNLSRVSGFFQAAYPFGFSSPGRESWCDFVALGGGACLLEKRLTLRRDDPKGHHHAVSLEPDEFKAWVSQIRHAEAALREEPFENSPEAWAERQKWDRGPDGRRR